MSQKPTPDKAQDHRNDAKNKNTKNTAKTTPPSGASPLGDKPASSTDVQWEMDSEHMGASEDQVIPLTPPTEALEKLNDDPSGRDEDIQQSANQELTPG